MRSITITFSFILLTAMQICAQDWRDMMNDPNANLFEVREAFEAYWADKEESRGKGIKQFKRWEWFMENRVDEAGYLPSTRLIHRELEKVRMQRSYRGSGDWSLLGPTDAPDGSVGYSIDGIARITDLTFHPTDTNTMYAGAPSGGLWTTTDGGVSWTTNTDHFPNLGVSSVLVHPTNDSIMYLATGDGSVSNTYSYGVLKSIDGGQNWDTTGLSFGIQDGLNIRKMIMDTANPDIILAAGSQRIYRTQDGGNTWENLQAGNMQDIAFKPGSSDTIYASNANGTQARVYRSVDGGTSWTALTNGIPSVGPARIKLGVTPADPNRVFAVCTDSESGFYGLYRSDNCGETWFEMTSIPNMFGYSGLGDDDGGPGWYAMAVAVSPTNSDEIRIGSANMWVSIDGGASFNLEAHWTGDNAHYIHADHHNFYYHPITGQFYACTDGGIFRKAYAWDGYDIVSDGLSATQFYRLSVSDHDPDFITGGTQDNGTMRYNGNFWRIIRGGDGMETIVSHSNPLELWVTNQNGPLFRSIDGGNTFGNDLSPASGPWVTPYIQDPQEGNILYYGTRRVYRSEDNGQNWFTISGNLTSISSSSLNTLAASEYDSEVVYASHNMAVRRTMDLGGSWETITTNAPQSGITNFALNPYNHDEVWVTYGGFTSNKKVYRTQDGGQNWDNMSLNLPNLPVNCVTIERSSTGGVYVGTDVGIYYWDSSMTEWEPFSEGLPNVIVSELEIHDGESEIVAATYGRGMWRSPTHNLINVSIDEQQPLSVLSVYPNPASDEFRIECTTEVEKVELLDAYGKKIAEFEPISNFVVSTSKSYSSGVYYLKPVGKSGSKIERLIITH